MMRRLGGDQAGRLDFNNGDLFNPAVDALAVISGPLSADDIESMRTILDWARHYGTGQELVENVQLGNFSSDGKRKALAALRCQLNRANNGIDVGEDQLWRFMKCFHVLGYDFDVRSGVTLSLVQSHISQLWLTTRRGFGAWYQRRWRHLIKLRGP